jgi:plasmid maintenance system antidote protein VapI
MDKRQPARVTEPWLLIQREYMARGISLLDLPDAVYNACYGLDRTITPERAQVLAEYFGTSAEFWLNAQRAYDDWKADHDPA